MQDFLNEQKSIVLEKENSLGPKSLGSKSLGENNLLGKIKENTLCENIGDGIEFCARKLGQASAMIFGALALCVTIEAGVAVATGAAGAIAAKNIIEPIVTDVSHNSVAVTNSTVLSGASVWEVVTSSVTQGAQVLHGVSKAIECVSFMGGDGGDKGGYNKTSHLKFSGTKSDVRWNNQIIKRGWTKNSINKTLKEPFATRTSVNRATGNNATVFYSKDGSYVIKDDITDEIIQISDKTAPWLPDKEIIDPYIP